MQIEITSEEKVQLEKQHKKERDSRICDRIKAVLLRAEGWKQKDIAQALRIRPETVEDHLRDYNRLSKLKPESGGSVSKLSSTQTAEMVKHLEKTTYIKVEKICLYVESKYNIKYTVSGMTKWLHQQGFSFKKPKGTPSKADPIEQEAFIETYHKLLMKTPKEEPILFADGVHPTMATKITYGWIKTGTDKLIATTASRTRINLMGAINLNTMNVTIDAYKTIDSEAMTNHFEQLRNTYDKAPRIHIILDRGPYNTSNKTKEAAEKFGIVLHHLPSYSPNLNPIERLWKVMNEYARNNRAFDSPTHFRQSILGFFSNTWPQIANLMTHRINDNFQIIKQVSSG